jgi:hypothetical protein
VHFQAASAVKNVNAFVAKPGKMLTHFNPF